MTLPPVSTVLHNHYLKHLSINETCGGSSENKFTWCIFL